MPSGLTHLTRAWRSPAH